MIKDQLKAKGKQKRAKLPGLHVAGKKRKKIERNDNLQLS
jgi:hypothetical protein